jgi:hypothetical protein
VVLVVQHVQQGGEEWVEVLQKVLETEARARLDPRHGLALLTSSTGNSEMIRPSFSSNVSCVNLTLRM